MACCFATSYPFKKFNMNIAMVLVAVVRDPRPYFGKLIIDVERVASTHSNKAFSSSTNCDHSLTSTLAYYTSRKTPFFDLF
jgi:hypothetical protein